MVTSEQVKLSLSADEVFLKYNKTVWQIALSRLKNTAAADDILQEVFVRYIKAKPEILSEEHLKAWLIKVTVNCVNKYLSCSYIRHFAEPKENLEAVKDNITDVYLTCLSLPKKLRITVHLFYYEGYSAKEISAFLGISETAVKQRLSRARKLLKNYLEDKNV